MNTFRLGLTGSIGMGKSTTAGFFRDRGIAVWDADMAVHRLYGEGGAAVAPIGEILPDVTVAGFVDRGILKQKLQQDPALLAIIEAVVHPLVAEDRAGFLADVTGDIAVFDIPLLFEKGTEKELDATLLVTAPPELQRRRVLARPGMTEAQFNLILSRQMPDREKRARATHILESLSLASAESAVSAIIDYIRSNGSA